MNDRGASVWLPGTGDDGEAIALICDEFGLQREPRMRADGRAVFCRSMVEMLRHADTWRLAADGLIKIKGLASRRG